MLLTEAQKYIIKDICSIQFRSLEDILTKVDLGMDKDGEKYLDIFKELGFDRKDFDVELIKTIYKFKEVEKDPDRVFSLEELDMIVFRYILHHFSRRWETEYPKAYSNLWSKLYFSEMSNELHNKQ